MLNTLLAILWIASIIFIVYFARKHNSRGKWGSIIACIVLFFAIGLLPSNQQKDHQANQSSSSSLASSNVSHRKRALKKSESKKKASSSSEDIQEYKQRLSSFAQAFGTKPVDQIQRMPSVYTADHVEDNMVYTWKPDGLPMLVRVDSPGNFTTVYQYDKHGEHNALGKKLYEGRTIYQKQKAPIVYD